MAQTPEPKRDPLVRRMVEDEQLLHDAKTEKPKERIIGLSDGVNTMVRKWKAELKADQELAKQQGRSICGLPIWCPHCNKLKAYSSPTSDWQNRVVCLICDKRWSH